MAVGLTSQLFQGVTATNRFGQTNNFCGVRRIVGVEMRRSPPSTSFPSLAYGQDSLVHNSSGRNYMPMLYVPYRYRALRVRSFALPVALKEIPLVKSASVVLTRSCDTLLANPATALVVPAIGIILFALWGFLPLVKDIRNRFDHGGNWKKSPTYLISSSYLQPLLLWTGATLICRGLDPVVLPSAASQAVKTRLLTFVRSLSTVLATAYILTSLIQQVQKFLVDIRSPSDTRAMGLDFTMRAVYTGIWIAAVSLFMELLGFNTQKWITAGGFGTVLLTLAGREIFTNFLSSVMINATRPFVVSEWINAKIDGVEVSGIVEHVGLWSPTIIRGDDREAIYIPNHKFTMSILRNNTRRNHWRIKTYLAISHMDAGKIGIIVADMRKVLAKNHHIEQQKLHRRVFFEKIDPKTQALMIILRIPNVLMRKNLLKYMIKSYDITKKRFVLQPKNGDITVRYDHVFHIFGLETKGEDVMKVLAEVGEDGKEIVPPRFLDRKTGEIVIDDFIRNVVKTGTYDDDFVRRAILVLISTVLASHSTKHVPHRFYKLVEDVHAIKSYNCNTFALRVCIDGIRKTVLDGKTFKWPVGNLALVQIYVSCFVKTSHFEEYLNVQEAVMLDLLTIVGHHRARLATQIRTVQKSYGNADIDNIPFGEDTYSPRVRGRPLLIDTSARISDDKKPPRPAVAREDQKAKVTSVSSAETKSDAPDGSSLNNSEKQEEKKLVPDDAGSKKDNVKTTIPSPTTPWADPVASTTSKADEGKAQGPEGQGDGSVAMPKKESSRPAFEDNIVLGVALEGSKRTLPIDEGMNPHLSLSEPEQDTAPSSPKKKGQSYSLSGQEKAD